MDPKDTVITIDALTNFVKELAPIAIAFFAWLTAMNARRVAGENKSHGQEQKSRIEGLDQKVNQIALAVNPDAPTGITRTEADP